MKKEEEETTAAEYNGLPYWVAIKSTAVLGMGGSRTLKNKNSSVDEIIIIIIINDNVYGAVIVTMVTARVHPVHLMNAD